MCFYPPPQCLENVIANSTVKEIEKERKRRYDTSDRHRSLCLLIYMQAQYDCVYRLT